MRTSYLENGPYAYTFADNPDEALPTLALLRDMAAFYRSHV